MYREIHLFYELGFELTRHGGSPWGSYMARRWELIPDLYCVQLNVFIILIILFSFQPNILRWVTLFGMT